MVKKIICMTTAGNLLLIGFGLLAVFHILVLTGIVPPDFVWGGQMGDSRAGLLILESIALVVTLLFGFIIAAKMNYILSGKCRKATTVGVWVVFVFLILNISGNLSTGFSIEAVIFGPVTIVLALCALRVAIEK